MNAVKNCLVVLAAAVALASCSADPTSSLAGKNPTISVTPGAVAIRVGQTQEVFASAVDALGGAMDGKFTITNSTPANFTAVIDTSYTPVTGGARPATRTRIVVTALKESDGSFTIAGTGGSVVIPVRVAPDTSATAVTFSNATPGIGVYDTATAPAGLRFTAGTTLSFNGSNGLFIPLIVGHSTDYTKIYFVPAPASHGTVHIDGMANVSTPTNTFASNTIDSVTVPPLLSFPAAVANHAPALNAIDTITITDPAWKFTGTSAASSSGAQAIVLGMSADSSQLYVVPVPDTAGVAGTWTQVTVTDLQFNVFPPVTVPTSDSMQVPLLASIGQDGPTGTIPTIQLPAKAIYGLWDLGTFDSTDYSPDGGAGAQYYRYNLGVAANVHTQIDWNVGNDVDAILLVDDGTYSTPVDGFSGASAKPSETSNALGLAVGTYLFDVINYGPFDTGGTSSVGARLRYQITVN